MEAIASLIMNINFQVSHHEYSRNSRDFKSSLELQPYIPL